VSDNPLVKYKQNLGEKPKQGYTPLSPFEYAFCEWLATQVDGKVPLADQMEKISELGQKTYSDNYLRNLKNRKEFKRHFAEIQKTLLARARAKLARHMPEAVDAHFKGMEMAIAANDHRGIPAFTVPILDRVHPKQHDQPQAAAVTINITATQMSAIAEESIPTVECEEITEPEFDDA